MQMTTETTCYGEWPSPITGADIARTHVRLAFPAISGARVWWVETRPAEGGRLAVVAAGPDGIPRDMIPAGYNARTRVHEYGGQSYLPVPGGLVFANFADQRLYHCADPGGEAGPAEPRPLTAAIAPGAADRFADFALSPGGHEVWCVRERHSGGRITRAIVAVPLDGSAAEAPDAVRVLVIGSDFYAYPAPSPDGTRLAWTCWDHPRMPWDGTELRVAAIGDTGTARVVMGGAGESVLAPVWRDNHSLYVISDRSGWWNLYLADLREPADAPRELCPREEEFGAPLWQLGMYPYAVLRDGRIAVTHGTEEPRLGVLDPDAGQLTDLDLPYQVFQPWLSASGLAVAAIAGGPSTPLSVIRVDVGAAEAGTAPVTVLRREADSVPDTAYLPVPHAVHLAGASGSVIHALVYPPANPTVTAPDGELPPYIVWVHGGPTGQVLPRLDLEKAFFTSRGIGIIDVNYGGSSGYGRAYRERLRGQWGVVDVADVMSAALALAEAGEADGKRLGIRGGSAGGWTALAAATSGLGIAEQVRAGGERGVFAAAASYSGVSDLRGFAAQTHDFESRYLDGLIGPLPECEALYVQRAPIGHVTDATCPILLMQGLDDPIVLPVQAESIAADLAAHGIPYAYLPFAGESHGFRRAETIIASLEAELSFYGQIMGFVPPGVPPVALQVGMGGTTDRSG
ncbi:MAG TPA: prolyl oligopeptidase family serine peptidase [Streptosporangiaceae bacterium]|nr:prolyl oligopeptidase family serine peptidase [Streptosporangiaceae bacterium]